MRLAEKRLSTANVAQQCDFAEITDEADKSIPKSALSQKEAGTNVSKSPGLPEGAIGEVGNVEKNFERKK